jgi:hypothetical protein
MSKHCTCNTRHDAEAAARSRLASAWQSAAGGKTRADYDPRLGGPSATRQVDPADLAARGAVVGGDQYAKAGPGAGSSLVTYATEHSAANKSSDETSPTCARCGAPITGLGTNGTTMGAGGGAQESEDERMDAAKRRLASRWQDTTNAYVPPPGPGTARTQPYPVAPEGPPAAPDPTTCPTSLVQLEDDDEPDDGEDGDENADKRQDGIDRARAILAARGVKLLPRTRAASPARADARGANLDAEAVAMREQASRVSQAWQSSDRAYQSSAGNGAPSERADARRGDSEAAATREQANRVSQAWQSNDRAYKPGGGGR